MFLYLLISTAQVLECPSQEKEASIRSWTIQGTDIKVEISDTLGADFQVEITKTSTSQQWSWRGSPEDVERRAPSIGGLSVSRVPNSLYSGDWLSISTTEDSLIVPIMMSASANEACALMEPLQVRSPLAYEISLPESLSY